MKKIIGIFFLLLSMSVFAQREANVWYFGNYAGLDFNSGHPIPLTDGAINRWEGVASICDSAGNLLMYTDGTTLWNSSHQIMPNGNELNGHQSSTESAIIIPYPNHDSLYYVFTVDAEGGDKGLNYSLVNMNLDNGNGDVFSKNNLLVDSVSEKVTAVSHKNGRDFWVVSHGWCTDSFFVYLVSPSGLQLPPQIYEIGTPHNDYVPHGSNAVGYLRFSPDGSKLALALLSDYIFEIYDFDNATGVISNPQTLPDYSGGPYGVEFSPDSRMLYMTSYQSLYQANITYSTTDSIINSIKLIGSSQTDNFFGAIQLATDGKIYLAHEYSDFLGVINSPTKPGDSCNFELNGIYLNGSQSRLGLPDFIQSYFVPPDIVVENNCSNDSTLFSLSDSLGIDSVFWDFGDILAPSDTSTLFFPKHKFSSVGKYTIKVTMWRLGVDFHKKRIIQINQSPYFNLGNDTLICYNDSILLNAFSSDCNYLWNDSSINSNLWAKFDTNYIAKATNKYTFCSYSDSMKLSLSPLPDFNLGVDTGFCSNDSIKIGISCEKSYFLWNTGAMDSIIYAKNSGEYILQITDSLLCKNSDTIQISEYQLPIFSLGIDTVICPDTKIELTTELSGDYLWNNFSVNDSLIIENEGKYWLKITDSNKCSFTDTINIIQIYPPKVHFPDDTTFCEESVLYLDANPTNCNYLWNTGSSMNVLDINAEGIYFLKSTNACGFDIDSINVHFKYCGEVSIPNIFTPNDDGINDYFKIKGIERLVWQLKIFNRNGQNVLISDDYKNDWQAKNNPDGVYYYILFNKEKEMKFSGFVRVYR